MSATAPISAPISGPISGEGDASQFPIDISDQYSHFDRKNIPVIEYPENCEANPLYINAKVSNIRKDGGQLIVDLHNDVEEDFLDSSKVVLRIIVDARKGDVDVCIPLSEPGGYAVAVYHDRNSNRKFDKNFLGIPKEHFGMSQNPKFRLSSPELEEAIFTVPQTGAAINIKLVKASDLL